MCGRYTLYSSPTSLAKQFSANIKYNFTKSYNIPPTSIIAVLVSIDHDRFIVPMRWGLIPSWHKEGQKLTLLNNAKIETVATKPSFRSSFKRHRCLILADGFYEWDSTKKPKQPHYFHQNNNQPFALAGIWDKWESENQTIVSCSIITEQANNLVSKVHNRMPAIISPDDYDTWLDTNMQDTNKAISIAERQDAYSDIISYPVTSKMNRVAYDNNHCIERIDV